MGALRSLGRITIVTAGTPVQVTFNETVPSDRFLAHSFMVQQVAGNTGRILIGSSAMVAATLANVYAVLPVPTVNILPAYTVTIQQAISGFNMADFFVDATVSGEFALVSVVRA